MKIKDFNDLGNAIRKRRKQFSKTQAEIGRLCGMTAPHISMVENGGQIHLSIRNLFKLLKSLHMTLNIEEGGK